MKKLTSPFKLIRKAVDIFSKKENFLLLVQVYLPSIFFPITMIVFAYLPIFAKNTNSTWFIWLVVADRIIYYFINVFVTAAGIMAIVKIVEGKTFLAKEIFESAWRIYPMFLALSIILSILYSLGIVLLIVPGLLFLVWFVFSRFIMIEKKLGVKASLLGSKVMVKGYFWKTIWRLIVFGLFSFLAEIILNVIPYGIGSIIWTVCGGLFLIPFYLFFKEFSE